MISDTTLAAVESLALPLVQEVVFLADFRCPRCQNRVAEVMAKMNGETESVVISILEKKLRFPVVEEKSELRKRILSQECNSSMLFTRQGIKKSLLIKASQHRIGFLIQRNKYFGKIMDIHDLYANSKKDQHFSSLLGVDQPAIKLGSHQSSLLAEVHCMEMRINLDCNACCRKMRRILLRMKEIETHMIEKQQHKVTVCGRFVPADVAIKIRKKMKRRVEILEIQELGNANGHLDQMPPFLPQPL